MIRLTGMARLAAATTAAVALLAGVGMADPAIRTPAGTGGAGPAAHRHE